MVSPERKTYRGEAWRRTPWLAAWAFVRTPRCWQQWPVLRKDRLFVLLDAPRFVARLVQLGYEDDPEFDFKFAVCNQLESADIVSTRPNTACDAFGTTWVERRRGAWMQSCNTSFN